MRPNQANEQSGAHTASNESFKHVANDIAIVAAFLILGVVLKLAPSSPETIWLTALVSIVLFFGVRLFNPLLAGIVFCIAFSIGAIYSFMAGSDRAIFIFGVTGLMLAISHHITNAWFGFGLRKILSVGATPQVPDERDEPEDDRKSAALKYVFGYTNRDGDTFKRRIARENLTQMGFMSQREWREWISDLSNAEVIETVNAQVTKPLVGGYDMARQLVEERDNDVSFMVDASRPGVMIRSFRE